MPKKFKGENSKVTAAKQKKALVNEERTKAKQAELEKKEQQTWSVGSKSTSKKEQEEAKRLERLEKKRLADELLKKEEASISAAKPKTGPAKLFPKVVKPSPVLRGEEKKAASKQDKIESSAQAEIVAPAFSASGIDNALDLFDALSVDSSEQTPNLANAKKNAALSSVIDRHPERRAKAAFKAYEERELPKIREEYKGLRLQQHKDILWKQWQLSPENPFNQSQLAYNATQDQVADTVNQHVNAVKSRLASN